MNIFFIIFNLCLFSFSGKNASEADSIHFQSDNDCVRKIITKDTSLGSRRNNDCIEISLSKTIDNYVKSLQELNFSECPEAFTLAFKNHIQAWDDMRQVTDSFPDIRGEMHVLFDKIELTKDSTLFKKLLSEVWSTWEVVEKESGLF